MEPKKVISPLVLIALFGLFAIVCAIVFLTRGKSARWIARKMKVGAAILTITGISTGCPVVTCYDPMPEDYFEFDSFNYELNAIVADLPADSIITGSILNCIHDAFRFEVISGDSNKVQSGTLKPDDGYFNDNTEKFSLALDSKIEAGNYKLEFWVVNPVADATDYVINQANLIVK